MGRTSSESKNKYNQKSYRNIIVPVRLDEELNQKLLDYQKVHPQGTSRLIKELLKDYFNVITGGN